MSTKAITPRCGEPLCDCGYELERLHRVNAELAAACRAMLERSKQALKIRTSLTGYNSGLLGKEIARAEAALAQVEAT